jgi:hypothetical protein
MYQVEIAIDDFGRWGVDSEHHSYPVACRREAELAEHGIVCRLLKYEPITVSGYWLVEYREGNGQFQVDGAPWRSYDAAKGRATTHPAECARVIQHGFGGMSKIVFCRLTKGEGARSV